MKKLLFGTILLALLLAFPIPTMAGVDVSIGISLPLPFVFVAPPDVIVMPDTDDVYVIPDIDVDIFFWNGWWWRLWEDRWYHSHYYDRDWVYYNHVPSFYFDIDPDWRGYYRDRHWYGHRWDYERIPYRQLQRNWKSWHDNRNWERRGTWGVQNYQARPQRQRQEVRNQRQEQYKQRLEVQQRHQQRQPQIQQRERQRQPQVQERHQQRQPQVQQRQGELQRQKSEGKPEGWDVEHRR